jgi:cobalt-zinc-cadmium efflux system protein
VTRGPSRLRPALALTAVVAVAEFAGGFVSHSLALLSDSAHVAMDVMALAIAVAAEVQASRPASGRQTYGFARLEMLAALANAVFLLAVTAFIVVEAIHRFNTPVVPAGRIVFAVAAFGGAVNVGVGWMLAKGAAGDLNVRAALFHVAGDAIGAFAVMLGGAAILAWGAPWIDPALSLFVAAIILAGVLRIVREAASVLLESAPEHAPVGAVRSAITDVSGVVGVHDLHVWTIGSGAHVLSAHVLLNDARISEATAILRSIEGAMRERFGVEHVTVQFECESCAVEQRIVCTQSDEPVGRP